MLGAGHHGGRAVAWVEVVLADAEVAANGEEGGGGAIVADGGNAFGGGDRLVGHSFGADIPGTGLAGRRRVSLLGGSRGGNVPLGELNDASVLGPRKPAGPGLALLLLVQHANHTRRIGALGGLGDTPHAQIAVGRLGSQHLRLLLGRGAMPGQAGNGRWGAGGGERVQDGEGGLEGGDEDGAIEVSGVRLVSRVLVLVGGGREA